MFAAPAFLNCSRSSFVKIVTDIIGAPVFGYRAPFFSIVKENIYLLETLADTGLVYDSSIFPVKLPRYGIEGFSAENNLYKLPNGKEIVELPMTTANFINKEWPVCGGGYIRLMPGSLINKIFKKIDSNGIDSMIYMHPYEFDTNAISVTTNYPKNAKYSILKSSLLNFRWNILRNTITDKLRTILKQHTFNTCIEKAIFIKENSEAVLLNI